MTDASGGRDREAGGDPGEIIMLVFEQLFCVA